MSSKMIVGRAGEELENISANKVRLTVTSPPYNIGKDYGEDVNDQLSLDEWRNMMGSVINELYRVTDDDGKVVINLGKAFTNEDHFKFHPLMAWTKKMMYDTGFDYWGEVVWDKKGYNARGGGALMGSYPDPSNLMISEQHELIAVFRKYTGEKDIPEPGTEEREKSKLTKRRWREITQSIWEVSPDSQENPVGHEATFPVEIPRRFIQMFSFYNDTILDPFMGTGTTLVAAKECGRKGLGIDMNRDYVAYAEKQVSETDWYRYPNRRLEAGDALEW